MRLVDLHTHSRYSDGTLLPAQIVRHAAKRKIELLSLTDHDTVEGLAQALEEARLLNVPFVCGVEISTDAHDLLHILGFGISPENRNLLDFLEFYRNRRAERIKLIAAQLLQAGVDISPEEIFAGIKGSVSRAHAADALVRKGFAGSRTDAFRKFLLPGKPGYVPSAGADVMAAISIVKDAGGMAVLAHPGVVMALWDFPNWAQRGLRGVEAYYPAHTESVTRNLLDIAGKYNLCVTAGSDYHGPESGRDKVLGVLIPEENFTAIKNELLR